MKNIRLAGFCLMLGCLLFWHVREMDFGSIYESASKVSVVSLSFALAVMFLNVVAVAFRSWRVLAHFGCRISWGSAYRAAMNANIASLMLTPLVGQVVGRQRLLEEHGVNPGMNAGLVVYERIVVFVSSLFLAGTSVLFYFAGLLSDRQFSWLYILGLGMTILLSLFAGLKWASHRSEFRQLEAFFNKKNTLRLTEIGLITLCSSLLMSFAYAALISAIAPDIPLVGAVSAALVISFLAGIPISLGGWGVRELAAIHVLGLLGVKPEAALTIAAGVGFLGLIVVILAAGITVTSGRSVKSHQMPKQEGEDVPLEDAHHSMSGTEARILWTLLLAVSVFVFFQLHVPVAGVVLNINLADPLALIFLLIITMQSWGARKWPLWRFKNFNACLAAIFFVLAVGLINGRLVGIESTWANSKLTGFFVLLGYLAAGALTVVRFGTPGLVRIFSAMAITVTAIMLFELAGTLSSGLGLAGFTRANLDGFSGNPNAFAMQILVVMAVGLGFFPGGPLRRLNFLGVGRRRVLLAVAWIGMALLTLYAANSRSGLLAAALVCVMFGLRRSFRPAVSHAVLFIGGFATIVALAWLLTDGRSLAGSGQLDMSSDLRLRMLLDVFKGWRDAPVFGQGFGWFFERSRNLYGSDLTIHGSPFWLLAEFGVVGLIPYLVMGALILRFASSGRRSARALRESAFLLLVAAAVMGLFHEVIYQRLLWLCFGAILALRPNRIGHEFRRAPRSLPLG